MTPSDERRANLLALAMEAMEAMETEGVAGLEAFLQKHPSEAQQLRERVEMLRSIGMLDAPAEKAPVVPEGLGEFRLGAALGVGGMGVVYVADQPSLGREVALKIIRPELLYFPKARERFRREIETIASLQHAGIVRVYSCGEAQGLPYFTMERIHGVTLDKVLDALQGRDPAGVDDHAVAGILKQLSAESGDSDPVLMETRGSSWTTLCFQWMRRVCDAMAYAHSRGVLHRDLKPSNIILTWAGEPILLDFGLASTQENARITRSGIALGSPAYMAPEQFSGQSSTADERCDVHALGVILHEMLALQHPYYRSQQSSQQTRRNIEEGAAPPLRKLNSAVPWDAATVCRVAMDPEPSRRYPSAAELGHDVRNVLDLRPIQARPVGPALRLRRVIQRHPTLAVASVLGFLLLVIAPSAFYLREMRNSDFLRDARDLAQREAEAAQGTLDFVVQDLLKPIQPDELGRSTTLREVFDRASVAIDGRFPGVPRVEASIRKILGQGYRSLDETAQAQIHLQRAFDLEGQIEFGSEGHLGSMVALASLWRQQGRYEEAKELLADAFPRLVALLGPDDPASLSAANNLGLLLTRLSQCEAAIPLLQDTLERRRRALGGRHEHTLATLNNLVLSLVQSSRRTEARPLVETLVEGCLESLAASHPTTLHALDQKAALLFLDGEPGEAFQLQTEVLRRTEDLYGSTHRDTLSRMTTLLNYSTHVLSPVKRQGYFDEFEERMQSVDSTTPLFIRGMRIIAEQHLYCARHDQALDILGPLLDQVQLDYDEDWGTTKNIAFTYARTLQALGEYEQAIELYEEAYREQGRGLVQSHWWATVAECFRQMGRFEEAGDAYTSAADFAAEVRGERHSQVQGLRDLAMTVVHGRDG